MNFIKIIIGLLLMSFSVHVYGMQKTSNKAEKNFIYGNIKASTYGFMEVDSNESAIALEEWHIKKSKNSYVFYRAAYSNEEILSGQLGSDLIKKSGSNCKPTTIWPTGQVLPFPALYYVAEKRSNKILVIIWRPDVSQNKMAFQNDMLEMYQPNDQNNLLGGSAGGFESCLFSNSIVHYITSFELEGNIRKRIFLCLGLDEQKTQIKRLEKNHHLGSRYFKLQNKIPCDGCEVIFNKSSLSFCSVCQHTYYCSKTCQTDHWKNGHKEMCKSLRQQVQNNREIKEPVVSLPSSSAEKILTKKNEPESKKKRAEKPEQNKVIVDEKKHEPAKTFILPSAHEVNNNNSNNETVHISNINNEINNNFTIASGYSNCHHAKRKKFRIPKLIKAKWNDTRKKQGIENTEEEQISLVESSASHFIADNKKHVESISCWSESFTETEASQSVSESIAEKSDAALAFKSIYRNLYRAVSKRGVTYRTQIKLSAEIIINTLAVLQNRGLIEITSLDKEKITANKLGHQEPFFEAHTTHASGKNKHWWQNKNVRKSFLEFVASCDPIIDTYLFELFPENDAVGNESSTNNNS